MATPLVLGAAGATLASSPAGGMPSQFMRDYWTAGIMLLGLCLLAYLTNPDPASFRTHITSQCFHTHLRRLSSSPARSPSASSASPGSAPSSSGSTPASGSKDSSAASTATANGKRKATGASVSAAKQSSASSSSSSSSANRHILSFSNRISLSIKTPSYKFTSYYLFSAVFCPPSRPTGASSGATKKQQQQLKKNPELGALLGLGGELWLGVFGKWYALKLWDNEEQEEEERRGRLERGVKEMTVEDDDKNHDYPSYSTAPSASASASGSSTPGSHALPASSLDRSSSVSSSHHHQSSDSVPPVSPTSKSGPAAARLAKRVFRAGQRRSSPTSLTRLKTKAEHAAREAAEAERVAADEAASSVEATLAGKDGAGGANGANAAGGAGGKAAVSDPLLLELQAQLDELRASAAEGEKRLQDELEVLRGKKRDEDAFRAELKAKTKTLEESKRVAEAARVEAEKELGERKGAVKEVQARVDKLREEIRALERKGIEVVERKEKKKRDRREREKKLKEDVGKKRDELKEKEKGLDDVLHKVADMERKLEVRRALLASRRAELAQLAVAGVRGGPGVVNPHPPPPPGAPNAAGGGNPNGLYGMGPPPHSAVPATATLGGVGAIANAFAVPFGQGAYGRRNYPYVHPLSANNSRPTSIRSGHFDPHTGAFQSAPSSPTLSHPVSPLDDALAPYGGGDAASGWPSSFASVPSGTAAGAGAGQALAHPGFLEHRLQHRAANSNDDVASHFLPFDFDALASSGDGSSPPLRSARAGSLTGTGEDHSPGGSSLANKPRPPLALPLQYLDSGLLATSNTSGGGIDSPGLDNGPLSPMTPHQTSLIPSQLFHMLDEDEDDDALFVMPDSPTLRGANILGADWRGLGLDVDDVGGAGGSRRGSGGSKDDGEKKPTPPAPVPEETDDEVADELKDSSSPVVVSPRAEGFSLAPGGPSATSSPVGPPPASPFSPWNDAPLASLEPASTNSSMHRLSPSQDLADDLPRAGLSLNPDAKAFAFSFSAAPGAQANAAAAAAAAHARTSSVPSPPTQHAAVANTARAARSGTASSFPGPSLPSPTSAAPPSSTSAASAASPYIFATSPPAKSRMEFANRSAAVEAQPLSARLSPGFDWPSSTSTSAASKSTSSPSLAPAIAPIGTGSGSASASGRSTPVPPAAAAAPSAAAAAAAASAAASFNPFNPFDEEDELLGPLRK
ncbi:hypothetical protein JCM6882_007967 [Rhodosporidiobolus microsporus]